MKKEPRKVKHWAAEAYTSLEKALILFGEEYPNPTEEQKFELVKFAPAFAAMNRRIKDKSKVELAYDFAFSNLGAELSRKDPDEEIVHSILFLLAYLDSHIVFGFFKDKKHDDIMHYLSDNYETCISI